MPDSKDIFKGLPEITIGEMGKSKRRGINLLNLKQIKFAKLLCPEK